MSVKSIWRVGQPRSIPLTDNSMTSVAIIDRLNKATLPDGNRCEGLMTSPC
jgi:hypothetical protein